jgi:putative zinc finger/helix-turn-helix YgiT family protein
MKQTLECPYCEGQASIRIQKKTVEYRKENFDIAEYYYECDKCNEEFTTTEIDHVTLAQAHNQYRERHGIPFIDEIISIRKKYGLSARKMSEILGLGINGYTNYENGDMPSEAIGNLIKLAASPETFRQMLEQKKNLFSTTMLDQTFKRVNDLIKEHSNNVFFYACLDYYNSPNAYTGYKVFDKEKVGILLSWLVQSCDNKYNDKLKLNKLLFYLDFSHFKSTGQSITGISYRAIQHGPVPTFYDNIFAYYESEGIIMSEWESDKSGKAREIFVSENPIDKSMFTKEEVETIEMIIEKFRAVSSWDLVTLSHKEKAWVDLNEKREIVSYLDYAFDLKGV